MLVELSSDPGTRTVLWRQSGHQRPGQIEMISILYRRIDYGRAEAAGVGVDGPDLDQLCRGESSGTGENMTRNVRRGALRSRAEEELGEAR